MPTLSEKTADRIEQTAYRLTIAADIALIGCALYVLYDEALQEMPDTTNTLLAIAAALIGAALLIYTTQHS